MIPFPRTDRPPRTTHKLNADKGKTKPQVSFSHPDRRKGGAEDGCNASKPPRALRFSATVAAGKSSYQNHSFGHSTGARPISRSSASKPAIAGRSEPPLFFLFRPSSKGLFRTKTAPSRSTSACRYRSVVAIDR